MTVAVLPDPPFPVILGQDWSKRISGKPFAAPGASLDLVMRGKGTPPAASTPCTRAGPMGAGVSGDLSVATDLDPEDSAGEGTSQGTLPGPRPQDPLGGLDHQFRSTPASFKREQWNDDSLRFARNAIVLPNSSTADGSTPREPFFVLENDLLYRVATHEGEVRKLLLIPRTFRREICELAHAHLLGAHLGAEKTLERIKLRFYWPGINEEVRRFCQSCPECQTRQIPRRDRAPLVPIPLVDIPFERIGVDLVGPLEPSTRGHKYILVMVDYATRYPEAVPLRSANTKSIARELVNLFSRVGIPKEVLTDQGTPFTSDTFKEVAKLLQIKHLKASVYHPQTDGLVERFNQTLKQMLRKVVSADGRNWDQLLPLVLFAYREVPQASTGFSPFELLYGRQPRGILDILKEGWEAEALPSSNILEYVAQLRDRLTKIRPLLKEHVTRAQAAQARCYNRNSVLREFRPGDRVMVLVPTSHSKLLAHWQGPYEVKERKGLVDYLVKQPNRRPSERIYHVNLLKPWKDREELPSSRRSLSLFASTTALNLGEELTPKQRQELAQTLRAIPEVVSESPGRTALIEHDIVTEPGVIVRERPYRLPEAKRAEVELEVKRMLDMDIIEESHSPWSSPIVLVSKPDGSWRFCNDFRRLNQISKFDAYPMPRIDDLLERLGTARYLTTLDMTKGYWQIPLTASAKEKTAFSTPSGHWQYKVLPFGLHGAPATFQRLVDRVLTPHQSYSAAYLDDVVIYSGTWEEHLLQVAAVLRTLAKAGLRINPRKCFFGLKEAKYLGYLVGQGQVRPQSSKVKDILEWPRPSTKKQVQAFLGLAGYYRRFVPRFSERAAPLTDLTKKGAPLYVVWTDKAEHAFSDLKKALTSAPVLRTPDFGLPFILQTDASDTGLGAVLSQSVDGVEHPVMYLSRKLMDRETRYAAVEREALAIKWAVTHLRYYLLGREFALVTDHAALQWMSLHKESNPRVTRWFLDLQPYKFTVTYRRGTLQANADALSRIHDLSVRSARPDGPGLRGGSCHARASRRPRIDSTAPGKPLAAREWWGINFLPLLPHRKKDRPAP
ncbi:POL2 protein, partial [Polypterus senegalus]|nr:POL2 protein [Polypterus senegalus]